MAQLGRNKYGDVYIDGSGTVHLGDVLISNIYNVTAAIPDEYLLRLQHLVDKKSHSVVAPRTRKALTYNRGKQSRAHKRLIQHPRDHENDADIPIADTSNKSSENFSLRFILKCLKQWLLNSWQQGNFLPYVLPEPIQDSTEYRTLSHQGDQSEALDVARSSSAIALRDHSIVGAALLSLVLARNVGWHDVMNFLVKCGKDDMTPVLVLVLGLGIYRYLNICKIPRAPSQSFWSLEDAYGHHFQLSMDLLVDFSVLQKYLHVHYQKASQVTGAELVNAGQFHIMLGSRRGFAIGSTNWSLVSSKVKPGQRVVNSLYITSAEMSCLKCKQTLMIAASGDFQCDSCGLFHRDPATFGLPNDDLEKKDVTQPENSPRPRTTTKVQPTLRQMQAFHPFDEPLQTPVENPAKGPDMTGIRNLDMNITARQQSSLHRMFRDIYSSAPMRQKLLRAGVLVKADLDNMQVFDFLAQLAIFQRNPRRRLHICSWRSQDIGAATVRRIRHYMKLQWFMVHGDWDWVVMHKAGPPYEHVDLVFDENVNNICNSLSVYCNAESTTESERRWVADLLLDKPIGMVRKVSELMGIAEDDLGRLLSAERSYPLMSPSNSVYSPTDPSIAGTSEEGSENEDPASRVIGTRADSSSRKRAQDRQKAVSSLEEDVDSGQNPSNDDFKEDSAEPESTRILPAQLDRLGQPTSPSLTMPTPDLHLDSAWDFLDGERTGLRTPPSREIHDPEIQSVALAESATEREELHSPIDGVESKNVDMLEDSEAPKVSLKSKAIKTTKKRKKKSRGTSSNLYSADYTGSVKWFNDAKGYGFIEADDGFDIFCHFSAIQPDAYGVQTLVEGERVYFDITRGRKGLQACDVYSLWD